MPKSRLDIKKIEEFVCPYCGEKEIDVKYNPEHNGIYCSGCGKLIAYVTYKDMKKVIEYIQKYQKNEGKAFRRTQNHKDGTHELKCSRCGCLLYDSKYQPPEGQFDLLFATYCPQCGSEFI